MNINLPLIFTSSNHKVPRFVVFSDRTNLYDHAVIFSSVAGNGSKSELFIMNFFKLLFFQLSERRYHVVRESGGLCWSGRATAGSNFGWEGQEVWTAKPHLEIHFMAPLKPSQALV